MSRIIASIALSSLAAFGPAAGATAQGVPAGVTATLKCQGEILPAGQDISLVLTLVVDKDAEVPADLLSGLNLECKIEDKPGPKVTEAGKGGTVALKAGTRIERTVKLPIARVLPAPGQQITHLALSWPDLPGANCLVQIAPDTSKVNLDDLDLQNCKVVLSTSLGDMTLAFRADKAPNHVKNFVKLAMTGFYDGTKFHRVIKGFMVQGGDPNTKSGDPSTWGQGGTGTNINAEFNDTKHVRGVLSMARSQDPNSASSQFFIVHKEASHLDNQYTAFGALEKGADVLDAIANTPVGGSGGSTPVTPVVLLHAILLPAFKK